MSDIINYHSLHHESFADESLLLKPAHITELDQLISRIQDCIADFKTWMIHNKLHRNDDKTELMLATPKKMSQSFFSPSFYADQSSGYFFFSICSISGVVLDQTLSFKQHVLNICREANLELRRISTIRRYLSAKKKKKRDLWFCSLKNRLL